MSHEKNVRILVVDDEDHVCRLLARWLSAQGYDCLTATSGEAAWEMAMNDPPGRITAICDVYDALIMDRPYRAALPEEEVLRIMTPEKGRSFDPRLFDIFMDVLPSFRRIGIELS